MGTSFEVQFIQYIILPFVIVSLVIILCVLLKKFFPRTLLLLTGSRITKC